MVTALMENAGKRENADKRETWGNALKLQYSPGVWRSGMENSSHQLIRHLLLRFSLGFILLWFGLQQVISPGQWTEFVPEILSSHIPGGASGLIFVHGALLTMSAIGIFTGLIPKGSCLLAAALLLEIIVVLLIQGDSSGLIVRDIGLLVMALVLALDQFPVLKLPIFQVAQRNSQEVI
jgi:hypothetical protein